MSEYPQDTSPWAGLPLFSCGTGTSYCQLFRQLYHFDFVNRKWEHRCGNLQVAQLYTITATPQNVNRCYGIAQDFSAAFKFSGGVLGSTMPGGSGETGKVLVDPVGARIHNVKDK